MRVNFRLNGVSYSLVASATAAATAEATVVTWHTDDSLYLFGIYYHTADDSMFILYSHILVYKLQLYMCKHIDTLYV